MSEVRSRAALDAAAAGIVVTSSAVVDHAFFGILPFGRATLAVAGSAALASLCIAAALFPIAWLVFPPIEARIAKNPKGVWRAALFVFFLLAGEALWSVGVWAVYAGPPIDNPHLKAYAAGVLPVLALSLFGASRIARRAIPAIGPLLLALGFVALFHGTVAWLYPMYPAGTSSHMVYNSTALGLVGADVLLAVILVRKWRVPPERFLRVAGALGLALVVLAGWFYFRWADSYFTRDAAARGGRLSRTFLRYTQLGLKPRGHGLKQLASRVAPAALDPTPSTALATRVSALAAKKPTGFLIVTTDATRVDAGDLRDPQSPLALFSYESLIFTHHHANAPGTREALTSTFTGRWFWTKESNREPGLFSRFHQAGYRTIAVGYASGSNQYVQNALMEKDIDDLVLRPVVTETPHAAFMTDSLLTKLADIGDKPFFAWVHYLDPHFPYDAPGATRFDRYRGEVRNTQREVARLLTALSARRLLDRTLVVVTADHGEEFYEHGNGYHNLTLYEEVLRVPLLVRAPGGQERGVVDTLTSSMDLAPALLQAAEIEPPQTESRTSVFAFTAVVPHPTRPVGIGAVIRGRYKLMYEMRLRGAELYDIEADPKETRNLVDEKPDVAAALANEMLTEVRRTGIEID